ncbi:MAG: hypothetical protein RhofKO_43630 [Rhodothermales bacterium]
MASRLLSTALVSLLLLSACADSSSSPAAPVDQAQAVVDAAIAAHGSTQLDAAEIAFDFRDRHFEVLRDNGMYRYERWFPDSTGAEIHDVLTNDTLYREIEGTLRDMDEDERTSALSGTNSVPYFAFLPLALNDAAVNKRYLGEVTYRDEPYHKVEVTFDAEGGGVDHEDRFIYWFHRDQHTLDYLAYSYDTDERGTRFRRAVNPSTVGGVRFQDYENYTNTSIGFAIERYDTLPPDSLKLLSTIETTNITVAPLRNPQ